MVASASMRRWLQIALFIVVPAYTALAEEPGRFDASGMPSGSYREISGQWAFWWNRFLDPVAAVGGVRADAYVPFPMNGRTTPSPKGPSSAMRRCAWRSMASNPIGIGPSS